MARRSTEERQAQIIDESIKIIHEIGYSKFAIRKLADQVGISEPAIYRHFKNKEEIILGILDRLLEMGNILEEYLGTFKSDREKIREFVLFHFNYLEENSQITSVVFSENVFQPNSALKSKLQDIITSRYRILSTLIDDAKRAGIIFDVDTQDLTVLIIGNIRMIVMQWRLSDFGFDLKERGNRAWQTIEKLIFNQQKRELDK